MRVRSASPEAAQTPSPRQPAPDGVFLCYRREQDSWPAGRPADALLARFGDEKVFIDVDRIRIGNWREQIGDALAASAVIIVLIGPRWLDALKEPIRQAR